MLEVKVTKAEEAIVDGLVEHYRANLENPQRLMDQIRLLLTDNPRLRNHVHSIRWRLKEPTHLRDKLIRKTKAAKKAGKRLVVSKENLFKKINDLIGFRILHLHTTQFVDIDSSLRAILAEEMYFLVEGPTARTWDDESRSYFKEISVSTKKSESMYTSVHYVFEKRTPTTKYTFEIQVRTLAEELWGEVDHAINYPEKVKSVSCREQIKVLARVTSSCTRLVDSIFTTFRDFSPPPDPVRDEAEGPPSSRRSRVRR